MIESTAVALADALVQETLLGDAIEHAAVGVAVFNDDLRYVAVNRAACDLFRRTREELLGIEVGSLGGGAEAARKTAQSLPGRGRHEIVRGDGTTVEIEWLAVEARAAGLPQIVGLFWEADTF